MQHGPTILVFAKPAIPGRVKTRLIGHLNPEEAARLHVACTLDAIELANAVPGAIRRLLIAPDETGDSPCREFELDGGWTVELQRGCDLGVRLESAIADAFLQGSSKTIVIGTDTPWMGAGRIQTALGALDQNDVVLGPAIDGGYYLVGARRPVDSLFREVPWGSSRVLEITRRALDRAGATYRLLCWDFDLDRPADLDRAYDLLAKQPSRAPHLAAWMSEIKALSGEKRAAKAASASASF